MDSNTIEFFVKMRDMMSGGLAQMAKNSQSSFGKVVQNMKQAHDNSQYLSRSVNELKTRLKEVNQVRFGTVLKSEFRSATTEAKSLERQINKMSGGGFRGGLRNAASALLPGLGIAAMVAGSVRFAKGAVNSAMQYELKDKMFQSLTGSRTGGETLTNNLFKLSQRAGFGKDVYQNAQTMLGYGVRGNEVETNLKQIGAITMGNSLRAKDLTLAYSQTIAAGKLIGKDLRQFVAAGFNPLQTISEHWKEFGFRTHKTIGELQEDLKKGKITADMVKKAMDIATSAGGKFGGTLAAMADTTQGKLQAVQGKWEAFKVGMGNAILPLENSFLNLTNGVLASFNVMESLPEKFRSEQIEINTLIGTITQLNQKNAERTSLIQSLITQYPDFFKNLNAETTTNSDLLNILNKVNDAYQRKIDLASKGAIVDSYTQQYQDALKEKINYDIALQAYQAGNSKQVFKRLGQWDASFHIYDKDSTGAVNYMLSKSAEAQKNVDIIRGLRQNAMNNLDVENATQGFSKFSDIFNNSKLFNKTISKKNRADFTKTYLDYARLIGNTNPGSQQQMVSDFKKLQGFLPSTSTDISTPVTNDSTSGKTASGITGGGPRVININGVKFADKIEIVHGEFKLGEAELEARLNDMFLRVLNSGASIQG